MVYFRIITIACVDLRWLADVTTKGKTDTLYQKYLEGTNNNNNKSINLKKITFYT